MAGINVRGIKQRAENDNDLYLLDNKCTPAWLQNTMNAHPAYICRGNPGYSYNIWGRSGLVSTLLKTMSLTVDDGQLTQKKQYFTRISSLIQDAENLRFASLQPWAGRAKYISHVSMITSLEDCRDEVRIILETLQRRIEARNAAALAAPPAPVPIQNAWRRRPPTEEPTQNTTQHV